MKTLWIALITVGLLAGTAGVAGAQEPSADAAAQAREHYQKGKTFYDLNRFDDAVKEFEAAYELRDEPVLLYNIAQSYRLANKYPEALRFYRSYLRRSPDAPNKAEVEQKIADMERLVEQQNKLAVAKPDNTLQPGQKPAETAQQPSQPATQQPAPAPEAPKPGRLKVYSGIAVAAVGVALVGGGVAMGVLAMGKGHSQEKSTVFQPGLESSGKTFQTVGLALDVVGGAAIAAGVGLAVWGVIENRHAAEASATRRMSFAPAVGRSYAGGAFSLEF